MPSSDGAVGTTELALSIISLFFNAAADSASAFELVRAFPVRLANAVATATGAVAAAALAALVAAGGLLLRLLAAVWSLACITFCVRDLIAENMRQ